MKSAFGGLAAFVCLAAATPALAVDCAKAVTIVEKLVCGRPELKEMDVVLQQLYPDALKVAQDPETVAATQRDWAAGLEACNGYECIDEAYQARLERLGTYFNSVQAKDAHFIAASEAPRTCVRIILPQRPEAKGNCRVMDYQPLGKVGGFERFYALYATSFRIGGSDFLFTAPIVLTADPAKPGELELNLALLDLPEIPDTQPARLSARPKLKADRRGQHLEFRIANDRAGLRAYGPGEGGRALTRLR
jgi:hypothetical protein